MDSLLHQPVQGKLGRKQSARGWVEEVNGDAVTVRFANDYVFEVGSVFETVFGDEMNALSAQVEVLEVELVEIFLPSQPAPFDPKHVLVLTFEEIRCKVNLKTKLIPAVPDPLPFETMKTPAKIAKDYGELEVVVCHATSQTVSLFSVLDLVEETRIKLVVGTADEAHTYDCQVTDCEEIPGDDKLFRLELNLMNLGRTDSSRWSAWVRAQKEAFR